MLVLARKVGQGIVIGGKIKVKIVSSRCGTVRIGIDAPREVSVHRDEVEQEILINQLLEAQNQGQFVASIGGNDSHAA